MSRRFDLVIFDLDGTLVDSVGDIAHALNRALHLHGRGTLSIAVVRGLIGDGVQALAARALQLAPGVSTGATAEEVATSVTGFYERQASAHSRVYDGVRVALQALQGRKPGVALTVLTNKPGPLARQLIQDLDLGPAFAAVVGDGDGWARKPSPDAAVALMARVATTPGKTLIVGDGLPDVRLAHAAGCASAAVTWGYTDRATLAAERPTWMVDHPDELIRILDQA